MDTTPHQLATIAAHVVHASVDSSDLTVGEILEGIAPGNGRFLGDLLMSAVAAGIDAAT